jgi:hypothetical protein
MDCNPDPVGRIPQGRPDNKVLEFDGFLENGTVRELDYLVRDLGSIEAPLQKDTAALLFQVREGISATVSERINDPHLSLLDTGKGIPQFPNAGIKGPHDVLQAVLEIHMEDTTIRTRYGVFLETRRSGKNAQERSGEHRGPLQSSHVDSPRSSFQQSC